MIVIINGFKFSVRSKATYVASECLTSIFRKYFWKYAPNGYYLPDGSVSLIEDPKGEYEGADENGNPKIKLVSRELSDEERDFMGARVANDTDYRNEILDFHFTPLGNSPLLSYLLEDYVPSDEEREALQKGERFFYENGIGSKVKSEESSKNTAGESQRATEATTQQDT